MTAARPQGGGRHATTTRYRKVKEPGHPLAQTDGQVYVHRAELFERIGAGAHPCHWCGREVNWTGRGISRLVADHLDGNRWNNLAENLVPACRVCNSNRARRADFLTHCAQGHALTPENTYHRRDRKGRMCRTCCATREARRVRRCHR